jgi:hypothetical protein
VDTEPGKRIRREVIRTERVRREVVIRLGSTQAMRLGAKLVFRGLVAKIRRRPVQLTLRSGAKRSTSVELAGADDVLREAPGALNIEPTDSEQPLEAAPDA